MVDAAEVVAEQRPMLAEFLSDVGLVGAGATTDLRSILPDFAQWLDAQVVSADDVAYLAARLAAYICVYLADYHGAVTVIVDNRIVLRVPTAPSIRREFDPYHLAYGLAGRRAGGEPVNFELTLRMLA